MAGSCLEVFVMAITLIFSAPSESKPTQDPPALPCEAPCWCDGLSLMNCSSSGISTLPMTIPESVTVLDLTHNNIMSLSLPDSESGIDKLKHLRLGYNKISHLSLCVVPGLPVTNPGYTPLPGFSKRFGNGVRSACASNLELLSVERNHLKNIPKGLGHLRSLQVIQLSHNRISAVHMEDLQNCNKLSAIYLQHNQITTIDPLAFQDLRELKVLNLSNNALTTIQPTVFVSLSNLQLELDVTNNNWICDCDLLDVKKWITVLSEGRQQSWCIVCKEPSQLSSQDLRNLEDFELSGETSVHQTSLSQEVAAYVGKKLVLPCSGNQKQDSDLLYWWTPHGQISKNSKGHFKLNNIGSLVINDVQESDGGLYVCIFGEIQTRISVLDIRIQENNPVKLVRKSRGADFLTRQGRTHSDFVLAVCLSVIITFICAFALGVVARPFLDHLWKKIHPQKSATGHIYENEGFAEERETGGRKEQTMHDEIHIPVINEDASDSRPQPNTPHYVTIHPVLPSSENQQDSSLESSNYQQALQKESRDGNPDLESVNTEDVLNVSSSQLPASSEKSQHFKEVHDNRSGNIKDDFHTQHESKEISNASQHGVSLENDTPSETANEIHPVLNDNLQDDPQNHQINHFDSDVIMEPPNCKEEKEHSAFSITKPDTQHNREDTAITVSKQVNVPNLSHLGRELEGHLFKEAEEEDVDFKFSDLRAKNDPWEASKTDPKGSDEVLPTQQDTKQNMNFSEAFAVHPEVLTDQNTSDECENESCKSQKQGRDFLNASHLTKEEDSPSNYKENEYERVLSKEQLTIEGKPSQNDRMEDNRLITANAEDVTEEEDVDQQKGFFNPDDDSHSNPPSEFGNDSGDSFEFSDSFNDTEYGNLLDFNLAQQLKTEAWPPFGESTSCILNPNQTLLDLQDNLDGSAEKPNHSLLQAPSNNVLSPKDVDDVNQLDTMFPELDYERYDYTTGSKDDHFNEVHDNRSGSIKDDFHTQHESKEISNASQHGVSLENDTPSEKANEIHPVLNDNLQDDPQNHQINHFDSDVIMEPPNCKEEKEHSAFSLTKPDTQHNREDTAITVSKQVNVPNLSQLGRELEVHLFKEAEEEDVDFKFSDSCSKMIHWKPAKQILKDLMRYFPPSKTPSKI
ncbi:leucine-rich repeat-containing protein 66 isoform X1 [Acipenser oxyrinchus oxyrinchus]|uniref:Leucine-rich repeat-containing protein 66 isoform X1 n=1 Tax=Acipenser oxyrinchus oxyrinchus TaxID=40147 RepID=A0AAD8LUQ1_ACIOX|nr:leucine-rich repeat-containing protein 66 isoform X1 [Acipenser oxyrinchus oxyrinchus]